MTLADGLTARALAYVGTGRGRGQVVIYIVEDG